MIVVDTNVIAYLLLPGTQTANAEQSYRRDHDWIAPILWRSELRSVLISCVRRGDLSSRQAILVMEKAEVLLHGAEYRVASSAVLLLAETSTLSAYDCEFVVLAEQKNVPLVTCDRAILRACRNIATSLATFGAESR